MCVVNILLSKSRFNEPWGRGEVSKYVGGKDKVVVVPFSFHEDWIRDEDGFHKAYNKDCGKYYEEIVAPFRDLGVKECNIVFLNYFRDSKEEMREALESASVVFFTGGFPEKAVLRVREKGIEKYLNDKVIIGISAGALMQLQSFHISPDDDYDEFSYYEGLGLIENDFYVEVHYGNFEGQDDCIKRVLEEKASKVYGIRDNGGIILDGGKITLLGEVTTFYK